VSVLIPTFNRPRYLSEALASVLRQSYTNLQIIVVNDGGEDVSDVIESYDDQRVTFINRKLNRGKAFSLNEALAEAKGKYVAYLDDDDLYYPNHIETLVNALEEQPNRQVAYSDLYKTYCQTLPDGNRQVLSKVVEVGRDFDRFLMLYFNHVFHVSLMHSRALLEKTGLYNEDLNILIDWDMTKRLAFFADFHHVCAITGEFYSPVGDSDRISIQQRKDNNNYVRNILTIRTTRPAKPWTKIKDLSIILTLDRLDHKIGKTIGYIWRHTFYPYKVYLPIPQTCFNKINTDMPNLVCVPVSSSVDTVQQVDAALNVCEGEYVAIVPSGFPVNEMWVEDPLYGLINTSPGGEAIELEASKDGLWSAVLAKDDLQYARETFSNLPIRESLEAAGIVLRRLQPEEIPFQFDTLLKQAKLAEKDGNWSHAAKVFQYIADHYQNRLWMKILAAKAFFKAGCHSKAAELSNEINCDRPTVDTLLLEAKVKREQKDIRSAIELLETAEGILEGNTLLWT
ncbi:MAG: glycosyltransferase, partial [Planctomycetota bacterium]